MINRVFCYIIAIIGICVGIFLGWLSIFLMRLKIILQLTGVSDILQQHYLISMRTWLSSFPVV